MKLLLATAALVTSGIAIAQPGQRDARGITVENAEPNVPAGVNQRVEAPPGTQFTYSQDRSAFTPRPATADYPPCQRGQTDRCVQNYERGGSATRSRRGRR